MFEQNNQIEIIYPQLVLDTPMFYTPDQDYGRMNTSELNFAQALDQRGLFVYREPKVEGMVHVPDFFVYNPFANKGKLVEITLMSSTGKGVCRKTRYRKERQLEELCNCGIPFSILYKENLECMKDNCLMFTF